MKGSQGFWFMDTNQGTKFEIIMEASEESINMFKFGNLKKNADASIKRAQNDL